MATKLILLLVIVLAVVAVSQLMKLYEISSTLKNRNEYEISRSQNRINGFLMLLFMVVFFISMFVLMVKIGWNGLGDSASMHGDSLDVLMRLNMWIVFIVFFVTNFLLFYFAYKYQHKPGAKAYFYTHSSKLEFLWTAIPASALLVMVIWGLSVWNDITSPASADAEVIEIYSKQFDWTVRYAGKDNKLAKFDYKVTSDRNLLGLVNSQTLEYAIDKMKNDPLLGIDAINNKLNDKTLVFNAEERKKMTETLHRNEEIYRLLVQLSNRFDKSLDAQSWDDIIVAGPAEKMYLCVDQEYEINFRSKDVIHSALIPAFRLQMNTVPGQTTRFKFTPTVTTKTEREKRKDPKYNYYLVCNKICGSSHYKMYMEIEVLEKDEYKAVMKAFQMGGELLSPKDQELLKGVFGESLPKAHTFKAMFEASAPAPAAETTTTEVADSTAVAETI
ncbi:MAG: cytochrome c oxidase subunit II [Crocinitomicaceae bacterium]|nr:cytochrome c oxidase subunit II [Crocinitomicaceae bacterium]